MAEPIEATRNISGPEKRHLRVVGRDKPLCGTSERQGACGGGRFDVLLKWPDCGTCRKKAEAMGPSDRQLPPPEPPPVAPKKTRKKAVHV